MKQYLAGTNEIEYGTKTIQFELIYTERDTLAVNVYPDCSVVVEAPIDSDIGVVETKVKKRAKWILKQQKTFEAYRTPDPNRSYVSGETHYYLGKRYRLKIVQSDRELVKYNRGRIFLYLNDTNNWQRKHDLLYKWYLARAKFIFQDRLDICYPRFEGLDIPYPGLQIRSMKSQWGSCTPSGKVILNLKLIKVPKKLIDYVIIHELCHLKEHNHSTSFYTLLESVLPQWQDLRRELNQFSFD